MVCFDVLECHCVPYRPYVSGASYLHSWSAVIQVTGRKMNLMSARFDIVPDLRIGTILAAAAMEVYVRKNSTKVSMQRHG